jgi:predicted Zn-dependent peptidase
MLTWQGAQKEPRFRLSQAAHRLLFGDADARRRDWEKPEKGGASVEQLTSARDTLVRLPGRVIAFAGDLTRDEAERSAAGLLPPVLDEPPPGLDPVLEPAADRPGEQTVPVPRLNQVYFAYARESLTLTDDDYPAFLVADHVLGGHFYSRLYTALRHEGGETYGASTTGKGGVVSGAYALVTFTRAGNAEVAEGKLRRVLHLLHEEGITEEERQAAVSHLLGRRPFSRQEPVQILSRSLWERRHGLPAGFRDTLVDRAAEVSLEEINAFIRRFYDPGEFTMVRVAPR